MEGKSFSFLFSPVYFLYYYFLPIVLITSPRQSTQPKNWVRSRYKNSSNAILHNESEKPNTPRNFLNICEITYRMHACERMTKTGRRKKRQIPTKPIVKMVLTKRKKRKSFRNTYSFPSFKLVSVVASSTPNQKMKYFWGVVDVPATRTDW